MSAISELKRNKSQKSDLSMLNEVYNPMEYSIGEVERLDNFNRWGRYYKTPVGVFPSVTTCLGAIADKSHLDKWRELIGHEEAEKITNLSSSFGNMVHNSIECALKGEKQPLIPNVFDFVYPQIRKVFKDHVDEIYLSEAFLYSKHIRMAGTIDLAGVWEGFKAAIDIKTSRQPKNIEDIDHYFVQVFLYACMLRDLFGIRVKKLVIMIFYQDGSDPSLYSKNIEDVAEMAGGMYAKMKQKRHLLRPDISGSLLYTPQI